MRALPYNSALPPRLVEGWGQRKNARGRLCGALYPEAALVTTNAIPCPAHEGITDACRHGIWSGHALCSPLNKERASIVLAVWSAWRNMRRLRVCATFPTVFAACFDCTRRVRVMPQGLRDFSPSSVAADRHPGCSVRLSAGQHHPLFATCRFLAKQARGHARTGCRLYGRGGISFAGIGHKVRHDAG